MQTVSSASASTGVIRNRRVLDFDNPTIPNDFTFRIAAAVRGDTTTPASSLHEARVRVRVLDTNDNAPIFGQPSYSAPLREDVATDPPLSVLTVTATDADSLFNGRILFELVEGNTTLFAVDALSGVLSLRSPLDYEQTHGYNLTIMAKDRGPEAGQPRQTTNVSATIVVIDVNDNAPVLNASSYGVAVYENATLRTELEWVGATDADSGDNGRVTFSLVEDLTGTPSATFGIDAIDGIIRLLAGLDFDSGGPTTFALTVRADDNPVNGDPSLRGSAPFVVTVLDVNDNAPQWAVDANGVEIRHDTSLAENVAVGTVVATVSATDADQPNTPRSAVRYSLIQVGSFFGIDPVTGAINLTSPLDFETATRHQVRAPELVFVFAQGIPRDVRSLS